MGLDQYAMAAHRPIETPEDDHYTIVFTWRKHAKLQAFMENLFFDKAEGGVHGDDVFNCNPMELDAKHIRWLRRCINASRLPDSEGGFFYGHEWQDEAAKEYREQDLQFCEWALGKIAEGHHVYYDCWW